MIEICSDFSGVGSLEEAYRRLQIPFKKIFACDSDKYARKTYIFSNGTDQDKELVMSKEHDYFANQIQKFIETNTLFNEENQQIINEANEFAKKFSFYFPFNVYTREIPKKSTDVYVTSPPCQAFSMAGKRLGKEDRRGVLFFNSLEFIRENKPRFFIFENVKGLLSHDKTNKKSKYGNTFQEWINFLGGKSINGNSTFLPYEDSVPYHIYFQVLNAKDYNVPQNRERVFIVGIRDDEDNDFRFKKPIKRTRNIENILEEKVSEKYFLSEKIIKGFISHAENSTKKNRGFKFELKKPDDVANCISTIPLRQTDNYISCIGHINQNTQASKVYDTVGNIPTVSAGVHGYANGYIEIGTWRTHKDGNGFRKTKDNNCPTIPARAREDGSGQPVLKIKSNTKKGYEEANLFDTLDFSNPNSKTRRGRVGVGVVNTLDTSCNKAVITPSIIGYSRDQKGKVVSRHEKNISNTIHTSTGNGGNTDQFIKQIDFKIRRLTPIECFRLMDFSDDLVINAKKANMSDTQLYKQAGNSIVVQHQVDINSFFIHKIIKNERK